jgi:RNA polymerase sigma factor (sigma-70 family)
MVKHSLCNCLEQVYRLAAVQAARRQSDRELLERFVAHKDEAAFAALVERHGRMVLGVCRRLLGSAHDAEDACQAAFLVLAQKAGSIRKAASLASWLHGVAARVAAHLRRQRLRQGRYERATPAVVPADPAAEVSWREVQGLLDEELGRLPEKLRAPLVLCYLDGRTRDAAARQLGLPITCLHGRLERGRKMLCERLARRGVTLSAALVSAAVGPGASGAALPPTLVLYTARAAGRIACGRALGKGLVSTQSVFLAREVAGQMVLTKLKLGVSALVCAGLLAAALGGALAAARLGEPVKAPAAAGQRRPQAGPASKAAAPAPRPGPQRSNAAPADDPGRKPMPVRGRVLGPDGKPVAGANVYLLKWAPPPWVRQTPHQRPPKVWARTGADGRFSFTAAYRDLGELFVTGQGYGPGWVIKPHNLRETWPIEDNQLVRLARDDVDVRGRLLDLQGRPVAGATVRVFDLKASPDGSLDKFIRAIKRRPLGQYFPEHEYLSSYRVDGLAHFFRPFTTDRAGRFRIKGVGRDRVVSFTIDAPAIETKVLNVVTRPGIRAADLRVPQTSIETPSGTKELALKPFYPQEFTHAAAPGRVVTGVVRDKAAGKPIARAVVRGDQPVRYPLYYNLTTTDRKGRFRLTGLPLITVFGMASSVVALPPEGEPYLAVIKTLAGEKGKKETTLDFDLPRGVWVEGQVKDKATGRGVQSQVRFISLAGGQPLPGLAPQPGGMSTYHDPFKDQTTDAEGKFRLLVAREHGVLGAIAAVGEENRYRTGVGADKIKGTTRDPSGRILFPAEPAGTPADSFDAVAEVKPANGANRVRCDLVLDPGRAVTVQVCGPDGKSLAGTWAQGRWARDYYDNWGKKPLPAAFTVYGLEPRKARTLLIEHPDRNLTARHEIKGDERGPVTVRLRPAGTVVGRLVDDDGRPVANAQITVRLRRSQDFFPRPHSRHFRTDGNGKFRISGLVPGLSYQADVLPPGGYSRAIFGGLALKTGQVKDLGDVRPRKGDSK